MDKMSQELWENCLEIIKKDLPEKTFDLWIKPIKAISITDDKFLIEVPNKFFIDWLKLNLQNTIEKELSKQINKSIFLEYSVILNLDEILRKTEQTIDPLQPAEVETIFSDNQSRKQKLEFF